MYPYRDIDLPLVVDALLRRTSYMQSKLLSSVLQSVSCFLSRVVRCAIWALIFNLRHFVSRSGTKRKSGAFSCFHWTEPYKAHAGLFSSLTTLTRIKAQWRHEVVVMLYNLLGLWLTLRSRMRGLLCSLLWMRMQNAHDIHDSRPFSCPSWTGYSFRIYIRPFSFCYPHLDFTAGSCPFQIRMRTWHTTKSECSTVQHK